MDPLNPRNPAQGPKRTLRSLGKSLTLERVRARHRHHVPGRMNQLEQRYANYLDLLKLGDEVRSWRFESLKLRLATRCWYTPDFLIVLPGGLCELHEVKGGHWEDDARVKIKVVAEQFPEWRFIAVREGRMRGTFAVELEL